MLNADLVVGAVLVPGSAAPRLVTRDMVREMKHGSMIVDVSIDPGGCCETSRPTSHADLTLADKGYGQALRDDLHLRNGLNVCREAVTCEAGAASRNLAYADPLSALAA